MLEAFGVDPCRRLPGPGHLRRFAQSLSAHISPLVLLRLSIVAARLARLPLSWASNAGGLGWPTAGALTVMAAAVGAVVAATVGWRCSGRSPVRVNAEPGPSQRYSNPLAMLPLPMLYFMSCPSIYHNGRAEGRIAAHPPMVGSESRPPCAHGDRSSADEWR